jgi:hypothetical protein
MKLRGPYLYFVTAVLFLTFACETDRGEENKGTIVIRNTSYDAFLEITDVWMKEPGSMDWVNYWHGSCRGGSGLMTELSFKADPGYYDIKIKAAQYGLWYGFYETGYLKSVRIGGGDYRFIIYDGNEIYTA